MNNYDVIIVGGGPAGLSAALLLGRCRRRVLLVDSEEPRNAASRALHGFLTRDGISPHALRRLGREQLGEYPSVTLRIAQATEIKREAAGFKMQTRDGACARGRILLLATGRLDLVPGKPGFRTFYGRGVYHCPYCDGWEHRDQKLGVYGGGTRAAELALELLTWSREVTIYSDGRPTWTEEFSNRLVSAGIRVVTWTISELAGGETLQSVCFEAWDPLPCDALFFCEDCPQKSTLPEKLGCVLDGDGAVRCDAFAATGVDGLYVAGNVRGGVHLAIIAAAEGAEAALAINDALSDVCLHASRVR